MASTHHLPFERNEVSIDVSSGYHLAVLSYIFYALLITDNLL